MIRDGRVHALLAAATLSSLAACDGGTSLDDTGVPVDAVASSDAPMDAPGRADAAGATDDAAADDAPSAMEDTGIPTDDTAVAPMDDAAMGADDAAVVAMDDAASAPDAFTASPDAFTASPDAFSALDAFTAPIDAFTPAADAFVPRDAFVPVDAPAAPTFCDVVYAIGGGTCASPTRTGRFHNIKTGLGAMNTYYDVGTNCAAPRRGTMGGTDVATPFTPAAFPRGYIRLRFPERGGAPTAGTVEMIEYFLPLEFTVSATGGTMVHTNVDHSAGLLRYASTGCGAGITGCVTGASDTVAPALDRQCRAVASGTLAGTTVMWGGCGVASPAPCVGTGCTASMAQLRWTAAMSQDSAMGAGCLTNMNTWGGVHCSAGLCGFVPGTGAPTNATWDQRLPNLTFSSTSYGAMGTTVTLTEMTIPDDPNDVYSGTQVITATAVHMECGAVAALTCDDE